MAQVCSSVSRRIKGRGRLHEFETRARTGHSGPFAWELVPFPEPNGCCERRLLKPTHVKRREQTVGTTRRTVGDGSVWQVQAPNRATSNVSCTDLHLSRAELLDNGWRKVT